MDPNSPYFLLRALGPELILTVTACALLLLGSLDVARRTPLVSALAGLSLFAALALTLADSATVAAPRFHLTLNELTFTVRIVTLGVGILLLLINEHLPGASDRGEFYSMVLLSVAGVSLVASADDLLLLFFALELVSVPTYVLVAGSSTDVRAQEAGVKYFFLGALSAALTVYGFSFLFGATGTTQIAGASPTGFESPFAAAFASNHPFALIGLVLALAGVAFKMAAVPFHGYAADVYQGAASPITGLLGFVPKFAGLIGIIKLLSLTGWNWGGLPAVFWALWLLAAATMTVGNVLALLQRNAKRVLAYSSIAHSGYLLVAVLVGPTFGGDGVMRNGLSAALFYMAAYGVMNLGAFAVLAYLEHGGRSVEDIDQLQGLSRSHPLAALCLAVCLFSLMGMPPTAGFFGKVFIFSSAFSTGDPALAVLAVIGAINAAIAAAYYLRLVAACYLHAPTTALQVRGGATLRTGIALCTALVLLLGLWPRYLMALSHRAAKADANVTHVVRSEAPTRAGEPIVRQVDDPAPAGDDAD